MAQAEKKELNRKDVPGIKEGELEKLNDGELDQIAAGQGNNWCPDGQVFDPGTSRCIKIKTR